MYNMHGSGPRGRQPMRTVCVPTACGAAKFVTAKRSATAPSAATRVFVDFRMPLGRGWPGRRRELTRSDIT